METRTIKYLLKKPPSVPVTDEELHWKR